MINLHNMTTEDETKIEEGKTEEKKEETEEKKGVSFEDEAAFQSAVDKVIEAREQAKVEKEEEEKRQAEADKDRFMPPDFKAKDWDEAARVMYPAFKERFKEELRAEQEAYRKKVSEVNRGFDAEIEVLRKKDDSIPERGTEERNTFDKELAAIGIKYGSSNMTQAYDIYKLSQSKKEDKTITEKADIRVEGEEETSETKSETKTETSPRLKTLASKVSAKSKSGGTGEGPKYSRIAGNSLDNLIAEELEKMS